MSDNSNVRVVDAGDEPAQIASEPERLQQEIAHLRDLDIDGLRLRWRNLFGRMAPNHLPKFLLLRIIAYRMQVNAYGDLGKDACRALDHLTRKGAGEGGAESAPRPCQADPRSLRVGTVFMREWAGVMHFVTVADDGFVWNGATYPSLSKVACAITGTRWNGPRFFGMRAKRAVLPSTPDAYDRASAESGP
ncbi:DUF2924 domain-containing protein [Methylocystis sp. SB2]|uniref:DUF2924 domain-containing protein n=1 Tax=Methylocystis sp. (strain SB2) TaxID=743836 RepID=UPI00040B7381|nr:DUF2924 domain-containing protein [Methylocystis sp. SB2]ULO23807.1 DUF2924 domain-containing protein [Methylocystis sp. SB2]